MSKMKFNHLGLFTQRPKRILNFYLRGLGFKKEYQTLLPKSVIYPIFKINQECHMAKLIKDDIALEIFWFGKYKLKDAGRGTVGCNHFGLEVKDREKFLRRLHKRLKLKIIKVDRGSYSVYFLQDPDKNLIEVKEPQKGTNFTK